MRTKAGELAWEAVVAGLLLSIGGGAFALDPAGSARIAKDSADCRAPDKPWICDVENVEDMTSDEAEGIARLVETAKSGAYGEACRTTICWDGTNYLVPPLAGTSGAAAFSTTDPRQAYRRWIAWLNAAALANAGHFLDAKGRGDPRGQEEDIRENLESLRKAISRAGPALQSAPVWDGARYTKPDMDIAFVYGYRDNYTDTDDISFRNAMRLFLQEKCTGLNQLCGFQLVDSQPALDSLMRTVVRQDGTAVRVHVHIVNASYTNQMAINIGSEKAVQLRKSKKATAIRSFFNRTADINHYEGHSRELGGGDMFPPVLTKRGGTDYEGYYDVQRPGWRSTAQALAERTETMFLSVWDSCDSLRHFGGGLAAANIENALLTDTAVDENEGDAPTIQTLNFILNYGQAPRRSPQEPMVLLHRADLDKWKGRAPVTSPETRDLRRSRAERIKRIREFSTTPNHCDRFSACG